jgi:hypothetical protein
MIRSLRRDLVLAPDADPGFAIGLSTHGVTFQLLPCLTWGEVTSS